VARKRAEQQIVIEGPPQACFDAITDYETYPDWQKAVKSCEVISRDEDGRGREVDFEIDAKVKSISYRLRYSYEEPHHITWDYLEGDVRELDGEFVFEDRGDGTTLATYTLRIDPGVWIPGKLGQVLNEQVMKGSMEDLKRRVEAG
jgi:ribosome-associated toxin RatA of RatAB toxin-antitoxin module